MKCPFAPELEVGNPCRHHSCWMNHPSAQGNCAAIDTGSVHLVPGDVARVYGETLAEAQTRIDRGRSKLKAWLTLLDALEDVEGEDVVLTPLDQSRSRMLAQALPLEQIVHMNSARWRDALAYVQKNKLPLHRRRV